MSAARGILSGAGADADDGLVCEIGVCGWQGSSGSGRRVKVAMLRV